MSKNRTTPAPAPAPNPAQPAIPMQDFAAFQPGQLGLLASQLNSGFGGGQAQNEEALNSLYQPVSMPEMSRPNQFGPYLRQLGFEPTVRPNDPRPIPRPVIGPTPTPSPTPLPRLRARQREIRGRNG